MVHSTCFGALISVGGISIANGGNHKSRNATTPVTINIWGATPAAVPAVTVHFGKRTVNPLVWGADHTTTTGPSAWSYYYWSYVDNFNLTSKFLDPLDGVPAWLLSPANPPVADHCGEEGAGVSVSAFRIIVP